MTDAFDDLWEYDPLWPKDGRPPRIGPDVLLGTQLNLSCELLSDRLAELLDRWKQFSDFANRTGLSVHVDDESGTRLRELLANGRVMLSDSGDNGGLVSAHAALSAKSHTAQGALPLTILRGGTHPIVVGVLGQFTSNSDELAIGATGLVLLAAHVRDVSRRLQAQMESAWAECEVGYGESVAEDVRGTLFQWLVVLTADLLTVAESAEQVRGAAVRLTEAAKTNWMSVFMNFKPPPGTLSALSGSLRAVEELPSRLETPPGISS